MAENRRIRKTKNAIKDAFVTLLKEKDLDKITVQDIAETADINRGTFYLHYDDKYILLERIEDEYIQSLSERLDYGYFEKLSKDTDIETFAKDFTKHILRSVLLHIQDNLAFYSVIMNLDRKTQIEEKVSQLLYDNMSRHVAFNQHISNIPVDYFHSYVSGAMISFIKHWVNDPNRENIDVITTYLFKIIFHGPLRLVANEHLNSTMK